MTLQEFEDCQPPLPDPKAEARRWEVPPDTQDQLIRDRYGLYWNLSIPAHRDAYEWGVIQAQMKVLTKIGGQWEYRYIDGNPNGTALTSPPEWWTGNGGSDVVGYVTQTSMMRGSKDSLTYRSAVRPRERHAGVVFVLMLIETLQPTPRVHIVGACREQDLPRDPEPSGVLQGAYVVPAVDLTPWKDLVPAGVFDRNESTDEPAWVLENPRPQKGA